MAGITPVRVYRPGLRSSMDWASAVSFRYYDVMVNGIKVSEVAAVPVHLKEMALGFLLSNGYIEDPEAVESISVEDSTIQVEVTPDFEFRIRSLRGKNPLEDIELLPVTTSFSISQEKIMEKVSQAMSNSGLDFYSVSDDNGYSFTAEDVKPETALYKAVGRAHMDHFDLRKSFFVTSFVLAPEDVIRLAYLGVPIVGTTKLPTDIAITVAENLGITLFSIGVDGVAIYTHSSRIQ